MSLDHVICTTCGTDNAAGLTFCQTCGSRLAGRAAPAPVAAPVPAPAPAPVPAPGISARPAAVPEARYEPKRVDPPVPAPVPAPSGPAIPASQASTAVSPPPAGTIACTMCGGKNDANQSFCLACGSKLVKPAAAIPPSRKSAPAPAPAHFPVAVVSVPQATPAPAPVHAHGYAPAPHPQEAAAQIAPSPVKIVSQPPPATPAQVRVCLRCRGESDPQAQFCRFCGAPMAEAPLANAPPIAAPMPAAAPVPPRASAHLAPLAPPTAQAFAPVAIHAAPANDDPMHATVDLPEQAAAGQLSRAALAAIRATNDADPATTRTPAVTGTTNEGTLLLIGRDGTVAATYALSEQMDIGRSEGDVRIEGDGYLSPRHARLSKRDGKTFLRDLDSVNGVYRRIPTGPETQVVGQHVVRLRDGELFLLGQQVLKVELVNDAAESAGLGNAKERGTLLFGTPASPRYARLCQRTVEGVTRDVYYVRKPETVLGRESGDVVFPEDPFLSRRHAILRFSRNAEESVLTLADLGSSNGTFVQVRGEVQVSSGDCFRIGQQLFRVDLPALAGGSASSSSSMRHPSA